MAQKRTTAETTLVGIKLYDNAFRLLDVYGEPDEIVPAAGGGGGGGGGGGAPAAAPSAGASPAAGAAGGGRRGGGNRGGNDIASPFAFGDQSLLQRRGGGGGDDGPSGGAAGGRAGGAATPPPAAAGGGSAPATAVYTRWIYKRGGGKYGFILDQNSRVIQIEAVGLDNDKVKTRRGIGFGATFEKVLRTYGLPDSYDIGGNSITMRYLLRDKVVFRLNRLGIDKPHVVTGVLVAAGKS